MAWSVGGNTGKCHQRLDWLWMERKSQVWTISNRGVISHVGPISSHVNPTWELVKTKNDWVSSQTYWIRTLREGLSFRLNKHARWFWCIPQFKRTIATDRFIGCACVSAESLQLCLTLWDPMLCSPSGSSAMEFFRWEHWSGLPCPPSGDVPHPGIEPASLVSPVLACGFFTTSITWEALIYRMSCDVMWKSLSCVQLFVIPQTKQSMEFFRQEYWSG